MNSKSKKGLLFFSLPENGKEDLWKKKKRNKSTPNKQLLWILERQNTL